MMMMIDLGSELGIRHQYGISALVHFAGEPVEKCQLFSQAVPFFCLLTIFSLYLTLKIF